MVTIKFSSIVNVKTRIHCLYTNLFKQRQYSDSPSMTIRHSAKTPPSAPATAANDVITAGEHGGQFLSDTLGIMCRIHGVVCGCSLE